MQASERFISLDEVAGDCARKAMTIGSLDCCQLVEQFLLLARPDRYLYFRGQDLAPAAVGAPTRRIGTETSRGIELELFDVLLGQEKDSTRFVCRESPDLNISVDTFICDSEHVSSLFDRNVSWNIRKFMNICHKSSLISGYFAVNWTLFPSFDKNIECTLECIFIGILFYGMAVVCEGKRGSSYIFASIRKDLLPVCHGYHLCWIGASEFSSLQVSLDCHERLDLYV